MKKIFFTISALVSLFFIRSCTDNIGTYSYTSQRIIGDLDSTLVMVYMAGANNLSPEVITDLDKMEKGLSEAAEQTKLNLKIVALCDQSVQYGHQWGGTRLYEVKPGSTKDTITSKLIPYAESSLGVWRKDSEQEEDMGNVATLKNFMAWARENYPECKNQMLIIWNHGSGVRYIKEQNFEERKVTSRSICNDEESSYSASEIHLGQLSDMLDELGYTGDYKLEFLGFDACYMASYEAVYQFASNARYMAASPKEALGGWNYEYMFKNCTNWKSGEQMALSAVDGYKALCPASFNNALTALNLSSAEELKSKVDKLASDLGKSKLYCGVNAEENISYQGMISKQAFYANIKSDVQKLSFPYFDLGTFLDYVETYKNELQNTEDSENSVTSDELQNDVDNVRKVLKNTILLTFNTASWMKNLYEKDSVYGLSIFIPTYMTNINFTFYNDKKWDESNTNEYPYPVSGYGNIKAANMGIYYNQIETWRELWIKVAAMKWHPHY